MAPSITFVHRLSLRSRSVHRLSLRSRLPSLISSFPDPYGDGPVSSVMSVHRFFCVIISHDMAISELITITSSLAESLNYFGSCLHSLFRRFHEHHVTPLPSFSSYRLQQHHPRDAILPQQFSVSCYSSCMASEQPLALRLPCRDEAMESPIPPGSSSSPSEQLFFLCVKCRRCI